MKKIIITTYLITIPIFISEVFAQPPPPGPGNNGVPVDGIGILAVLGIYLGVKKLRQNKKK